jgi:hypothetical protein
MMSMVALLKEGLETGEISTIKHIPTQLMTADGRTKTSPKLKVRMRDLDLFASIMVLGRWKVFSNPKSTCSYPREFVL